MNSSKSSSEWASKINYLIAQIRKLKEFKDIPTIPIFIFLLESQLVEVELRRLLIAMESHTHKRSFSEFLRISPRRVKDLENLTLGQLEKEVNRYEDLAGNKLLPGIHKLVKKRNEFTHKLFEPGKNIESMLSEAKLGVELSTDMIVTIEQLSVNLMMDYRNDPILKSRY